MIALTILSMFYQHQVFNHQQCRRLANCFLCFRLCTSNTIIDSIGGTTLQNGIAYWIGVVAVDDWGNMAVEPVNEATTTSYSDTDQAQPIL